MKITILEACNLKNDSLPILECGGVFLKNGQKIKVRTEIVSRMLHQYKPYLVRVSEKEVEKLQGGHYEMMSFEKAEPEKKVEHKEQPVINPVETKSENKSMQDKTARRRRR